MNNIKEQEAIDISELKLKITDHTLGLIPDEKFNQFRLSRGVYGQRQIGSQMIRIKIPFGRLTASQLIKIAEISDKYADGISHITTRQNIQYHYVKLKDAPKVWEELSETGLTLREACGNTVRNITASPHAGVDPEEPFDVSLYCNSVYEYFIRNPICQDLGRKVKIAFSSSDSDSAFTYFNDIGFIPRVNNENERGFKVVIGGGLGSQSIIAQTVYPFLNGNEIIPFIEAVLRVFDRHGERNKRNKARLKYLVKKMGANQFLKLVNDEMKANKNKSVDIRISERIKNIPQNEKHEISSSIEDIREYELWKKTNVFKQKQNDFYGINIKIELGDLNSDIVKELAQIVRKFAADDIRLSINQGIVLRFIKKEHLPHVFHSLAKINLADPGFDSVGDITACPGTDTCNLGITNSTGLAQELENIIKYEYSDLLEERFLKIKISGCMNSCGQHMAANIGFHGSSLKVGNNIVPAMQLVLGGGVDPNGVGYIAERIRKLPTKRVPRLLRILLSDFEENGLENEYYNSYFRRLGVKYFITLVKPLEETNSLKNEDFIDWGENNKYNQSIGIGECAGVTYDVISILIDDTKQKMRLAEQAHEENDFADSIYFSYSVFINGAKSILLKNGVECNTQMGIVKDYQKFIGKSDCDGKEYDNFEDKVMQINKNHPSSKFSKEYLITAKSFLSQIINENNLNVA